MGIGRTVSANGIVLPRGKGVKKTSEGDTASFRQGIRSSGTDRRQTRVWDDRFERPNTIPGLVGAPLVGALRVEVAPTDWERADEFPERRIQHRRWVAFSRFGAYDRPAFRAASAAKMETDGFS